VINIISAPPKAPQICSPSPLQLLAPRLDPIDRLIIETVKEHGPVKLWSLLNYLAQEEGERSRAEGRKARLNLWRYRIKRLKWLGLVFGRGRNQLAITRSELQLRRRQPRRSKGSVLNVPHSSDVSVGNSQTHQPKVDSLKPVPAQLVSRTSAEYSLSVDSMKTQTAPDASQITEAAQELARLPRRPKRRWSGWIGSVRSYRNMPAHLTDGRVVYVYGARRGRVVFTSQPDGPIGSKQGLLRDWGVLPASQVVLAKNEAAVALGRLKKGVREIKSVDKVSAARRNGAKPCRPGKKRGRPRILI
jgi:hypothetical protein